MLGTGHCLPSFTSDLSLTCITRVLCDTIEAHHMPVHPTALYLPLLKPQVFALVLVGGGGGGGGVSHSFHSVPFHMHS